jgi:hypothetical protein
MPRAAPSRPASSTCTATPTLPVDHGRQRPEQDSPGRDHGSDSASRDRWRRARTRPATAATGPISTATSPRIEKGGISPNLLLYIGTGTVRELVIGEDGQEGHRERHRRHAADRVDGDEPGRVWRVRRD